LELFVHGAEHLNLGARIFGHSDILAPLFGRYDTAITRVQKLRVKICGHKLRVSYTKFIQAVSQKTMFCL